MDFNRRSILKITGFSIAGMVMFPRVAFAARNTLRSLRTGVQPNDKTRLVIETANRPSYSLSYPQNQLIVRLANTAANSSVATKLASGGLVKSIVQSQQGDALQLTVNLKKQISEIPKSQIMILSPNGDNDFRLVLDFSAGTNGGASSYTTASASKTTAITASRKYVIVIDAGHGGYGSPGTNSDMKTYEKDVLAKRN
mgnify:CR=1 FL=1